jgi:HEPN domain-containing protein
MNQPNEAAKLLRLARKDLVGFRILRDTDEADASLALCHAQQCVEKCLKAVLAYHSRFVPKIHDLLGLAELVEKITKPPVSETDLEKLTPYAATMRYDELEYAAIDYKSATKIVEAVFNWAKGIVGEEQ